MPARASALGVALVGLARAGLAVDEEGAAARGLADAARTGALHTHAA